MKKRLFRIIAVVLCILMTAGITVSAKSSDSFIHYYANGYSLSVISRDMYEPAFKINDECISCGVCAGECPVDCIAEGDGKYVIDADACISCGNCASVYPVGAPEEE